MNASPTHPAESAGREGQTPADPRTAEPARGVAPTRVVPSQQLILCVGLQRSGNHAVVNWIRSLFAETAFHNDQDHRLFADPDALRAKLVAHAAPVHIVTFEDSRVNSQAPGQPLLESLGAFPDAAFADYTIHRLVILRDPYNTWASRVAANRKRAEQGRAGLTSDPSWAMFRENWLQLADLAEDPAWHPVLFNRWREDAACRGELCARLGGTYSEATLGEISSQGGGSSFDGVARPSYLGMLRRLPRYASKRFLRRLVTKPGYYVRRFVGPPASGHDLQIDRRWATLDNQADGAALFADTALRQRAADLFGEEALPPVSSRPEPE